MHAYAFLMHSNPRLSGPGALADEEDEIALAISFGVTLGHCRVWPGGGGGSMVAMGGGGKSTCRNMVAFSWKVVAVFPLCLRLGVGSVFLGLVYLRAVNISFTFALERKESQCLVLASRMVLKYLLRDDV